MTRIALSTLICLLPFACGDQTSGRSPDQLPHSPVPSLKAPLKRANTPGNQSNNLGRLSIGTPSPLLPGTKAAANSYKSEDDYREAQLKVWNSPAMQAAIAGVREFCKVAAQTSDAECEQFLKHLSELSPEEMSNWLNRYQERSRQISAGQRAEEKSRKISVENSIRRQEAQRQVATNVARTRSEAELLMRIDNVATPIYQPKPFSHLVITGPQYNPFELVFDPASPTGAARQFAAGISLPGDLPRDDPANFVEAPEVDAGP